MEKTGLKQTGCCERFDPKQWEDKEIVWKNKLFVTDSVVSLFHIPLNFGQKVAKNMELIEKAGAKIEHQLMLTDEMSMWGADIYIDVTKEVAGAKMARLSGTFLTKVFEGPFQNIGKWIQEMKEYVKGEGKEVKKILYFYTTCPKCAKVYGKNYVVLFAKVK